MARGGAVVSMGGEGRIRSEWLIQEDVHKSIKTIAAAATVTRQNMVPRISRVVEAGGIIGHKSVRDSFLSWLS